MIKSRICIPYRNGCGLLMGKGDWEGVVLMTFNWLWG